LATTQTNEGEFEVDEIPTILVHGRIWREGDPKCDPALTFAKKARDNGFLVKIGYSKFATPRKVYGPDTQNPGMPYGGDEYHNVWVAVYKGGKGQASVTWKSRVDKPSWTAYHRTCTGIVTFPIKQEEINTWLESSPPQSTMT